MDRACGTCGVRREIHGEFWFESMKEPHHLDDTGVDWKILLKYKNITEIEWDGVGWISLVQGGRSGALL
jgi:hypothetical protein